MIELVFIACFSAAQTAPGLCEERSLIFTEISPMTCTMGAQPELARWVRTHPDWTISRWTCRYLDTAQKDV
ncbi:hypothetical protein SAMN05444722_2382 [Rhodovulum sp. ES.010]|uniref:hypothetical protein n=1 Tax=Rhodovulum sp. ES.010 TaxID=1882821 RepID=UPI000928F89E|nr:hypothetical protein [Rhodovulum sp. ES.010]SIO47167.1 hypothetical protein SAMN05444722_2382 [Rhodovulum sp. ES.010]